MADTTRAGYTSSHNDREARRRRSRRARRDRYWRYRTVIGNGGSARQLAISISIAVLATVAAAAWHHYTRPVGEERHGPLALCGSIPRESCLIDGDTGRDNGKKWRLISVDAPELAEPECENERRLAIASRDRLQELLSGGYRIRPNGRDDPNGRALVDVFLDDGRDVGRLLMSEGLAQKWPNRGNVWCGRASGPPTLPRANLSQGTLPRAGLPRY
jgi:endonuclease YncB( thermonuclease family)